MVSRLRNPLLALGVALYLSCLMVSPAVAGMVGSVTSQGAATETRQDELSRIQRALETEIVKEKLKAYGLTPGEIEQKLQGLSDEQIHMLAQASDRVLAGGDALGVVIAILVIILLVILILKLTDKSIVIK
ncbi:MAG: PA2779 family protein [Syntrophaceae bacterium]|nr:PA2779 family protein [Syntrophaceae bacterium]